MPVDSKRSSLQNPLPPVTQTQGGLKGRKLQTPLALASKRSTSTQGGPQDPAPQSDQLQIVQEAIKNPQQPTRPKTQQDYVGYIQTGGSQICQSIQPPPPGFEYVQSANHLRYEVIQRCINLNNIHNRKTRPAPSLNPKFLSLYTDILMLQQRNSTTR